MKVLERSLGLTSVVAISMSAMLGSELFVLPSLAIVMTGPSVWLAYLVAGLLVLPATLSKSELATAMPVAGGDYVYIERAFGPLAGTIAGLGLWLSLSLKSAFALVGFGAYLAVLTPVPQQNVALVLLVVVIAINIAGVRRVGSVQRVVVVISVGGLAVLAVWGVVSIDVHKLAPHFSGGAAGFWSTVGLVYISYAGVTKVAAIAEEVKNPGKTLPMGMMVSLLMAMAIYAVVTLVLAGHIAADDLRGDLRPIFTLANSIGGPMFGYGMAALGVLTMTSMANAGLLAASRFPFAMSRDQLLPPFLSWIQSRLMTPVLSILVTGALMGAALVLLDIERMAKLAGSFMILMFLTIHVVLIVFRESGSQWYKPKYRSPLYPWVQLLGIISSVGLLVAMGPIGLVAVGAIALPGVLLYVAYGRSRTTRLGVVGRLGPRKKLLADAATLTYQQALPKEAGVVVPLFGRERSPEVLVEVGLALAEGRKVEVVHLTDVPDQLELDALVEEGAEVKLLRRRIEALAAQRHADIEIDAVVTRDVVETVHEISNRVHCDWVVMDWQARAERGLRSVNPIGWLVHHLSANLALLKDAGISRYRDILVLAEPGPHDSLVVTTADHLAQVHDAKITLLRYVPEDVADIYMQGQRDYLDQLTQLCSRDVETVVLRGRNLVESVAGITGTFDLLVKGAPPVPRLWEYVVGTRSDRLARRAACSVLRLATPRSATHHAVERGGLDQARADLRLMDFVVPQCMGHGLPPMRKEALFSHLAVAFAGVVPGANAARIEELFWKRERAQNTAVGSGVAMPHATMPEADRTYLGVFVTTKPMDYQAPDGEKVDVLFATLGPPQERTAHLLLLARLSRLVLGTDLLWRLRAAEDVEGMLKVLRDL